MKEKTFVTMKYYRSKISLVWKESTHKTKLLKISKGIARVLLKRKLNLETNMLLKQRM